MELGAPCGIVLAIAGIERGLQLLDGVVEVDHRGAFGCERVEIAPVDRAGLEVFGRLPQPGERRTQRA